MGLRPTQGDEKCLGPATTLYGTVALSFVIPSVPGFPAALLSSATPDVVLFKENHTQPTEAENLDRKSGEPRDLQFRGPLLETRNTLLKQNCHLDRSVAKWRDLRFP